MHSVGAGMHDLAESGGAAHAAYKGGLDAVQAMQLQAWTRTLQTQNSAEPLELPQARCNQEAAAQQLFRSAQKLVLSDFLVLVCSFTGQCSRLMTHSTLGCI